MRVPLEELLNFFVVNGRQWVTDQRNLLRPRALPIAAENRAQLQHYFTPAILARAQCTWVDEIPNPEFYAALQTSGRQIPLDFRQMTGITFLDTIVIARSRFMDRTHWLSLLFHELVHVVQYHILGCDEFLTQYVYGWARNEFNYVTTQPGTSGTRGVPKKTLLRAAIALCPCFFIVEMSLRM